MNTSSSSNRSQSEGRRIVRKTAVELVAEKLRNRILNGKLAPGSQLRQEALAEELGVSRIPLREAFRLLSSEGLVELQPHRGAFVSMLSASEVEELFELRQKIEPWLIEEASAKISEEVLKQAERLVAEMDKVRPERWGSLNWQLHEVLYHAAEKPAALALVKTLHDKSERYFRFQIVNAPIRKQSRTEHLQLIKSCRERNGKVAREVMQHHIQDAAVQILAIVRQLMDEGDEVAVGAKAAVRLPG
ncbi:GntR family transcriptional regulator [Herbaspirillum sp. RV1423]|uniref:GntR family transcriptional regulator n=1 Tax=Herbaspirillum sp. RV1423 TaxID=1443993 RepID=UPI0027962A5D|nr:GntR family transcriptional regulator [Herbaspirillum sp. RV1423]